MKFVLFYHSLLSDWNHGNAHFLRGVASELKARQHSVSVYEPRNGWSLRNLLEHHGEEPIQRFHRAYPHLGSHSYELDTLDLREALRGADVVLVHEWNDAKLINAVARLRAEGGRFRLFFHDTHHRLVTDPPSMQGYNLAAYDGVLAYGQALRDVYLREGRARRVWVWHEAADTNVFRPVTQQPLEGDLVWVGNWGDDERTQELREFLLEPVQALGLKARVYGVRYPAEAQKALAEAGIEYAGWLPNFDVPAIFGRFRVTVHVPRRPYVQVLPGIPTIRVFEALACGIPMVCSPWDDAERLFSSGHDFLVAQTGKEMRRLLAGVLQDGAGAQRLAAHGLRTIQARHTCAHRVEELLQIVAQTPLS